MSDDGIDNDGNTENDSTTTSLTIDKRIEATKTFRVADNGDGENGTGDVVTFTITVQNTGQIALSGITLVDLLTDCTGTLTLTMASGPTWNSNSAGSAQGSLNPGEIVLILQPIRLVQLKLDRVYFKHSECYCKQSWQYRRCNRCQ